MHTVGLGSLDLLVMAQWLEIFCFQLVQIPLAIYLWGDKCFVNKKIIMLIDNSALVSIVNRQSQKSKRVMMLIRRMVLLLLRNNIMFKAQYIIENSLGITVSSLQTTSIRGREVSRDLTRWISSNDVRYEENKLLQFGTAQYTRHLQTVFNMFW